MKRFLLLLLAGTAAHALTLEEAKRVAIDQNNEVKALREAVTASEARTRKARSQYLPRLGLAGGYDTWYSSLQNFTVPVGYAYGTYNLFNRLDDARQVTIEEGETALQKLRLAKMEFRVGLDVEKAFHLYLFRKAVLGLKENALVLNENHRKLALGRQRAGMAAISDVMEFDLRDSLIRSDILAQKQELQDVRIQLRRLLGDAVGSSIEPTGELQHRHLKGRLDDYLERLPRESEGVLSATQQLKISESRSGQWISSWLPRVDLEARAGYLPLDIRTNIPNVDTMYTVALLARWELFSGLESGAQRAELTAERLRREAELRSELLNSKSRLESAFRKIETIQARVDLEVKNEERARKFYDTVVSEYRRGVKSSTDIRASADLLFDAGVRHENYKYEFLSEKIEMERALGGTVETELLPEPEHAA